MSNTETGIFNTENLDTLINSGISIHITTPNDSNDEELGIVVEKTWKF
jgi:hypothetical protein